MLSFFGRETLLKKMIRRGTQFDEALQRARARKLPPPIVALYEATAAAHRAVAQEYENLAAAAERIFEQAVSKTHDTRLTAHATRAAAFEREVADFKKASARSANPQADPSLQQREKELIERAVALAGEREQLLKGSAAFGGIVNIFDRLEQKLKDDVVDFDLTRVLKQVGGEAGTTAITVGADVLAPGSGVIIAGSHVADHLIEGQMIEDEKAQHHFLWLDTYRRAAEDWARLAGGVLEFGESA